MTVRLTRKQGRAWAARVRKKHPRKPRMCNVVDLLPPEQQWVPNWPLYLTVIPVPAPRQTGRDAYDPSPQVRRYRAFRDAIRAELAGAIIPPVGLHITFLLPMPRSWPARRKERWNGLLHQSQNNDVDNLAKSVGDALWPSGDGMVADLRITKRWAEVGGIILDLMPEYKQGVRAHD